MYAINDTLRSKSTGNYTVVKELGLGGQGFAYQVRHAKSGGIFVAKLFKPDLVTDAVRTRIRFLVENPLTKLSSAIAAPFDMIDGPHELGHISDFASGLPITEFLESTDLSFLDSITLAIAFVQSVLTLHENGVAHGDLSGNNAVAECVDGVYRVMLFDCDNLVADKLPPPTFSGQLMYYACELRSGSATPSIATDLYAMTVLLHEILLRTHPAHGFWSTEAEFDQSMLRGRWLHDPMIHPRPPVSTTVPVQVLNAELTDLFRRGLADVADQRPSALQWRESLKKAMDNVTLCPTCGGPSLIHPGNVICPHCKSGYPNFRLISAGGTIELDRPLTVIGREQLGGSPKVSARHAVIRRLSGGEMRLQDCSSNGTFRWNPSTQTWIRLPKPTSDNPNTHPLIIPGDYLCFGDAIASVDLKRSK